MISRRLAAPLLAASLLAALPAAAQNALTVYGGYRGGGSFDQTVGAATTTDDVDSGAAFALAFEWAFDASRNGQLFASGQRTHLQLAPGSGQASVPLDIGYLHLGGVNYFEGPAGHGGCVVSIHGDGMFQGEALLGLSMRF